MLSQLRQITPISINSHSHIEFESAHKHSHPKSKEEGSNSDHRHLEQHLQLMRLQSLLCKTAHRIELRVKKGHSIIMKSCEMANTIVV